MNQSENINELASALSKAQGEMQAAIKDSVNPFFKSKYADLGSVWDAARPVLSKNGLCIMQTTEIFNDKIVMVTTLAHTSGQWMKSYLPLNPSKNDSQGVGAAITYLRRYSLSAIVGVVCDEDDDGETAVGRGKTIPSPAPFVPKPPIQEVVDVISSTEAHELLRLRASLSESDRKTIDAWLKKTYNIDTLDQLPSCHFEKIITSLVKKVQESRNEKN